MRRSVLLLFLLAAPCLAQKHSQSSPAVVNPPPLRTYRDPRTEVTFAYPAVWKPAHGPFDYCTPALFQYKPGQPKEAVPVRFAVQFDSVAGTVYDNTELNSLLFLFGVIPHSSPEACSRLVTDDSRDPSTRVMIAGHRFAHGTGGECGLGHGVDAELYTTLRNGNCLVFEEDFFTAATKEDAHHHLTRPQINALQRHLDAIMQSVRIAASPETPSQP